MKKFLRDLGLLTITTGVCLIVIAILFYDILPSHYSFFYRGPTPQIYADFLKDEGQKYNTIITGVSDMKRNIIPEVLDQQDPDKEIKSFAMGMGGMSHTYLIDYLDYLFTQNPNINRVVLGIGVTAKERLVRTNKKPKIDEMLFWRSMTPSTALFYTMSLRKDKNFFPLDLGKLLIRKYFGFNMMNIIKYRSINNPESYTSFSYNSLTKDSGDRGVLKKIIDGGRKMLGVEKDSAICGEKCKAFFEEKKRLNTARIPQNKEAYYDTLAEQEASQLLDFIQRSREREIEIIVAYFPRAHGEGFIEKGIISRLRKNNCFVIDFTNPEEYPEFYDFEYSLGKYQNRKGSIFASQAIGKIISQNTHEYTCN